MPFYDYKCGTCPNKGEYHLPMSHKPPQCEDCETPMRRVLDGQTFSVGGSGLETQCGGHDVALVFEGHWHHSGEPGAVIVPAKLYHPK